MGDEKQVRSAVDHLIDERAASAERDAIEAFVSATRKFKSALLLDYTSTQAALAEVAALIVRRTVLGHGSESSLEKYADTLSGDEAATMRGTAKLLGEVIYAKTTEVVVRELRQSMYVARELIERGDVEEVEP